MKRIILALACVGLAGGVASADRFHGGRGGGGGFHGGGTVTVRDHRGGGEWRGGGESRGGGEWRGAREGGVRVTPGVREWRGGGGYNRPVYNSGYRYSDVRRPIYVERPYIRERYYDYRYRPQIVVENYPTRAGYFWVAGQWTWNGYEWLWQPGHYQPDPSYYNTGYYDDGAYQGGAYDNGCTDADGDCD